MPGRAYNIGSNQAVAIRELAETVRKVLRPDSRIVVRGKPIPGKKTERYVPDVARILRELNVSIENGLEKTILKTAQCDMRNPI